eukprot:67256-Chlamydomonas_euryale.AAC.1
MVHVSLLLNSSMMPSLGHGLSCRKIRSFQRMRLRRQRMRSWRLHLAALCRRLPPPTTRFRPSR